MKSIIIKSLGPIDFIELNLDKQINLIIGQQSVGKSTLVKAINAFRSFPNVFYDVLVRNPGQISFEEMISKLDARFSYLFSASFSGKLRVGATIVSFHYKDECFVSLKCLPDGSLGVTYSPKMIEDIKVIYEDFLFTLEHLSAQNIPDRNASYSRAYNNAWLRLNIALNEKQCVYIPAERSLVNYMLSRGLLLDSSLNPNGILENSELNFFVDNVKLARQFFGNKESAKLALTELTEARRTVIQKAMPLMAKLKKQILQSDYTIKGNEDYLKLPNGEELLLHQTSSGQQEIIWILNVLEMFTLRDIDTCVIIEEPEANLFPNTQRLVMEFIALFANTTGSDVYITTHSPYMLSSLNLLLYAGKYGEYADSIDKNLHLNSDEIAAIYMNKTGHTDIMNEGEVDMRDLDQVSVLINEEADKIMSQIPLCEED